MGYSGEAVVRVEGPVNTNGTNAGMRSLIEAVIADKAIVYTEMVSNISMVLSGQFSTGKIDFAGIQAISTNYPKYGLAAFAHELAEQWGKSWWSRL